MTDRIKRLESLFLTEIASFISKHHSNTFSGIITITGVSITRNMQSARVFYSVMGSGREDSGKILLHIRKQIVQHLVKRIRVRRIPSIIFEQDNTAYNANKFECVLKEIQKENKEDENRKSS